MLALAKSISHVLSETWSQRRCSIGKGGGTLLRVKTVGTLHPQKRPDLKCPPNGAVLSLTSIAEYCIKVNIKSQETIFPMSNYFGGLACSGW